MGLAFDVALLDSGGRPAWPTDDAGLARWERVGALGEALGLVWGGRWRSPDWPHFQARDAQKKVNARIAGGASWRALALALGAAAVAWAILRGPRRARRARSR